MPLRLHISIMVVMLVFLFLACGAAVATDINAGLVAYWSFDDCTAKDNSGNGNNGILHGSSNSCVMSPLNNKAFLFNGIDSDFQIQTSQDLNVGAKVSYSAWINPKANNRIVFRKWAYGREDKSLSIDSDGKVGFYLFDCMSRTPLFSKSTVPLDKWSHIAAIYDGVSASIYINGVLDSSVNTAPSCSVANDLGIFDIGGDAIARNSFFRGAIDELRIYNRALTNAEVSQLASGSTSPFSISILKVGNGTVTSAPAGINCGAVCKANFTQGAAVTLTAKPATGSTFTGWSGACINKTGACTVTMTKAQTATANFTAPPFNAMLLLHGINSGPDAWKEWIKDYWGEGNCVRLYNGKREVPGQPIQTKPDVGACYVLRFGAHDTSYPSLEDAGVGLSGDFSTTAELGQEVQAALKLIRAERPAAQAQVALLAHSRGGLAARAFLQQSSCTEEEKVVQSLTTVVTPHQGSRFGRAYRWLAEHPRPANCTKPIGTEDIAICQDWKTVDFLRGAGTCNLVSNPGPLDVRRPMIDFLSDLGSEIKTLNDARGKLLQSCGQDPIRLRWLTSTQVDLGYLGRIYKGALYTVLDRRWSADWCEQLSNPGANYLVSGAAWEPGTDYQYKLKELAGDGIIHTAAQSPADWNGKAIGNTAPVWKKKEVLHTEAPAQTADISNQLKLVRVPWWDPSVQSRQDSVAELAVSDAPMIAPTLEETQARWARWNGAIQQVADGQAAATLADDGLSLRQALAARTDPAVLQDMTNRLAADSTSLVEVGAIADVLALTAKPETATLLVDSLLAADAQERQVIYRRAIERLSAEVTVAQRAGVTEALLTGWQTARREPDLNSLALALGTASDPEGVAALIEPLQTRARRGLGLSGGTAGRNDAARANAAALGLSKVWRAEAADVLIQSFETAVAERWPVGERNLIARALSKTGSADAVPALLGALASVVPADQAEVKTWVEGLAARRWSRLALEDWLRQATGQPAWAINLVKEVLAQ